MDNNTENKQLETSDTTPLQTPKQEQETKKPSDIVLNDIVKNNITRTNKTVISKQKLQEKKKTQNSEEWENYLYLSAICAGVLSIVYYLKKNNNSPTNSETSSIPEVQTVAQPPEMIQMTENQPVVKFRSPWD